MAKKIGVIVVVLAAIAVVAVLVLGPEIDRRAAELIERYGEATTGTQVDVGGVDIALSQGRGTIDRLTVGNPEGFDTDYAVRIDAVEAALDVGSLAREAPVVTELLLDGVHINAEQRGDAINLTEIQENTTASSGEPAAGAEEEGRIIVSLFRATNATLTITSELLGGAETVDLEDVVVRDVGGTQGAAYSEAAAAMLGPVIDAALAAVRGHLQDAAENAAREEVDEEAEELEEAKERVRDLLER